jgi:glycosyltransferase involved in cell wall biosynthesis
LVIGQLADGLVARGHEVTLFASGDSHTRAELRSCFPHALELLGITAREAYRAHERAHVAWAYGQAGRFDLFHDHTKANGTELAAGLATPVVTTVHNDLTPERRAIYGAYPRHPFIAISHAHQARMPGLTCAGVVYNGMDLAPPIFRADNDGYLLFLGRLDRAKGADVAVRLAAALDLPLIMAGRIEQERVFYESEVAPHLDGVKRRYVGEVAGRAKWELYAGAKALVFPIQWEEPFGLVMIEAMACGTPVLATRRGSVPEIVLPGETGAIAPPDADLPALADALRVAFACDPAACRRRVIEHFSAATMVEAYEAVYQRLLAGKDQPLTA